MKKNIKPLEMPPPNPDTTGFELDQPLIYMWEIRDKSGELKGRYVGKAENGARRPMRDYKANVDRLLQKKAYRTDKPTYRRVHYALAEAVEKNYAIQLSFLCNVKPGENIYQVEMQHIREMRCFDTEFGLNVLGSRKRTDVATANAKPAPTCAASAAQGLPTEETMPAVDRLVELVETRYGDSLELEVLTHGYSWYIGNKRIVRARQRSARSQVYIKLAVSSRLDKTSDERRWDGQQAQLFALVEHELSRFRDEQG